MSWTINHNIEAPLQNSNILTTGLTVVHQINPSILENAIIDDSGFTGNLAGLGITTLQLLANFIDQMSLAPTGIFDNTFDNTFN